MIVNSVKKSFPKKNGKKNKDDSEQCKEIIPQKKW